MSGEEHGVDLETEQICQSWMKLPKSSMSVRRMHTKVQDLII